MRSGFYFHIATILITIMIDAMMNDDHDVNDDHHSNFFRPTNFEFFGHRIA